MPSTEVKFSVGDKVIYSAFDRDDGMPVASEVERITPSGKFFYVRGLKAKFPQPRYGDDTHSGDSYRARITCQVFSDDAMRKLTRESKRRKIRVAKERKKNEQEKAEREARFRARIATVKTLVRLDSFRRQDAPSGDRIYMAFIPVKPEYAERKVYEFLTVVCRDYEDYSIRTGKTNACIEAKLSKFSGNGGSGMCSRYTATTDEEAIYEAVESAYFSW